MAGKKDKRGRPLPKGIQQRADYYEARPSINGQRYYVKARTVTEVKKLVEELRYKVEHGLYVAETDITVDGWFDTWLEDYKKNRIKIGTYNNYRKYYSAVIKERFGKQKLSAVRGEHIQRLYNDMISDGYAVSSIKVVSAVLHGMFKQAVKNGLIIRNPVELAEIPRQNEKPERIALTRQQQSVFMEYAKESYLYNLFAVMLRTGMRSGEIRGLRYSDIDKSKKVIHIDRTLKYIEGEGYLTDTPKTKSSRRDIPYTKDTLMFLDNQKNYWHFRIERMDRFLFCNEQGEPLSRDRVQAEIDRIVRRINADAESSGDEFPRITPHVFRHTFATRAIEAGMKPQTLKTIMGHSSLAMTMDLYSHVLPDTRASEMEAISAAF